MNTNLRFGGSFIISYNRLSDESKRLIGYHQMGSKLYKNQDDFILLDSAGRSGGGSTGFNDADRRIMEELSGSPNRAYVYIPEALSEKSAEYRQGMVEWAKEYFAKGY